MSKRKGAWGFSAVWTFPGHMIATTSTDTILLQNELLQMETEMKRLVLQAQRMAEISTLPQKHSVEVHAF